MTKKLLNDLKQIPCHPILLAITFVLTCFRLFEGAFGYKDLALGIVGSVAIVLIIYWTLHLIFKDWQKTALLTSIFVLWLLFNADLRGLVERVFSLTGLSQFIYFRYSFSITTILIAAIILVICYWKQSSWKLLNNVLNMFTFIYLSLVLFDISRLQPSEIKELLNNKPEIPIIDKTKLNTNDFPNIFFIVLDSHASSKSLKTFCNYDNTSFSDELKRRGFFVNEDARSQYGYTDKSIPSILNMNFLRQPRFGVYVEALLNRQSVKNSVVPRILSSLGYQIKNLSLFDIEDQKAFFPFEGLIQSSFSQFLWQTSLVGELTLRASLMYNLTEKNFYIFNSIPLICDTNMPVFLYSHTMMPHYPFLFDRNGNRLKKIPRADDANSYLDQLIFTDKLTLKMIDSIGSNTTRQTIVILQGDHGFRSFKGPDSEEERTSILFAVKIPNGDSGDFKKTNLAVNSFRIIFNRCFGTHYSILEDNRSKIGN